MPTQRPRLPVATLLPVTLLGLLVGCQGGAPATRNAEPTVVIVDSDPGEDTVTRIVREADQGGIVVVEAPGNGGTGYTWSMTAHSDGLELTGTPVTTPVEAGVAGGPNRTVFRMRVTEPGRQTARLELARTWEADTPPARVLEVVINVAGGAK